MKNIFRTIALLACITFVISAQAQENTGVRKGKRATTFTLGAKGFRLENAEDWLHTNPSWQETNSRYAMTRIDSNDYVYTIPNLRSYYGVSTDSQIRKIGIIFKDSLGEKKTNPMFIPVWRTATAGGKQSANWQKYIPPGITVEYTPVYDSTESVIIHFHPYTNTHGGKTLKGFNGTIFVYSGVLTKSANAHEGDSDDKEEGDFDSHWGILDIGANIISDNTDYNSPAVKNFLNVPAGRQNGSLLDLRHSKSINVNIYPFMETFYALKRKNQKINISTGIGLQLYNFRYENPITYTRNPNTIVLDSQTYKKNKLGMDYLNVPLMITFKTRLHRDRWLIYGAGITAGYDIATWTKKVIGHDKSKVHDDFGFASFNSCVTAEIGISGIRFYGTYQLTNMFSSATGMDQHPISFGIRFFAI